LGSLLEELHVLWIRAGPTAFDVLNPESVKLFGDAELVQGREIDAFALAAVAQGCIVEFDFGFHNTTAIRGKVISTIRAGNWEAQMAGWRKFTLIR
jgi:hypothetical protein